MEYLESKELYEQFCQNVYIPIYSKSWWLDAVCGKDNWNVWLCMNNNDVIAAMPYYFEKRGEYSYITKALLTQNNGIIFKYPKGSKEIAKRKFEERVINQMCEFIAEKKVDVYEQQFHYNFTNWLPFFWNGYTEITRYTYVIEDTSDIDCVWQNVSSNYRNMIRKGIKNGNMEELPPDIFFKEHEKIFLKQDLRNPFSYEEWIRLYDACKSNDACKLLCMKNKDGDICSVLFLVWDDESAYHLLGGNIPQFQTLDTHNALTWEAIKMASEMGLKYDFEGSMIQRISKSFREFGGFPKPYFRIRKIFNPQILQLECDQMVERLNTL